MLVRGGIILHSAQVLYVAKNVTTVAFDKTGTLSQGDFTVEKSEVFVAGAEAIVYQLVKDDKHPIAQGICRSLTNRLLSLTEKELPIIEEFAALPGSGMRATLDGYELLGGKPEFTGTAKHPIIAKYKSSGLSTFTVTLAGTCLAIYGLADHPRPEASQLLLHLRAMGKKLIILSGDNEGAVHRFAGKVGVAKDEAQYSCIPEDKASFISNLRSKGEVVLFVGDGTNDGPALATADVSMALASGSEVAHTSAGTVLLSSNIYRGVILLLHVARMADLRMRLALAWCAIYMVAALILASGAAVSFSIEPRWAGLGEVVSIIPVVAVGLSMHWVGREHISDHL